MDIFRRADQMSYFDTMPIYPARDLLSHATLRGCQVGSIAGITAAPFISLFVKRNIFSVLRISLPIFTTAFAIGSASAPYAMKLDEAGVDDRAYRLSKRKDLQKADRYTLTGAALGVAGGALANVSIPLCVSAGIAVSTLVFLGELADEKYGFVDNITKKTGP